MAYGGISCTQIKEGWKLEDQKHYRKSCGETSDMYIYSSRYGWNVILFIYTIIIKIKSNKWSSIF